MIKQPTTTKAELDLIIAIRRRAENLELFGPEYDAITQDMDLEFANAACSIDLDGLLQSKHADFMHDLCGIRHNINRETGELDNGFAPRHAIKKEAWKTAPTPEQEESDLGAPLEEIELKVNERELSHILAALRKTQTMFLGNMEHFHGEDFGPLCEEDIDELCEALNGDLHAPVPVVQYLVTVIHHHKEGEDSYTFKTESIDWLNQAEKTADIICKAFEIDYERPNGEDWGEESLDWNYTPMADIELITGDEG